MPGQENNILQRVGSTSKAVTWHLSQQHSSHTVLTSEDESTENSWHSKHCSYELMQLADIPALAPRQGRCNDN